MRSVGVSLLAKGEGLAAQAVFVSMQYTAIADPFPLVTDGTRGPAFQGVAQRRSIRRPNSKPRPPANPIARQG